MALFVIADLHLSLDGKKPMDIFPGWNGYVERLEKNWRAVVSPEDTVVIAGDVSWAIRLEDAERDFAFLHALPGKKLLLKGNHDYWWSTRKKIESFFEEHGFYSLSLVHNSAVPVENVAVCGTRGWVYNAETPEDRKIVSREVGRLTASLNEAEAFGLRPVVFLHYPPLYYDQRCDEILNVLLERGIGDCYFGHIHGTQAAKRAAIKEYRGIRMHLISCDYVKFAPVLVR